MSASTGVRADKSAVVPTEQHAERREYDAEMESEQAYVARLRRSISQMQNGDVQPCAHEGLEELRRELDTDAKDTTFCGQLSSRRK